MAADVAWIHPVIAIAEIIVIGKPAAETTRAPMAMLQMKTLEIDEHKQAYTGDVVG